MKLAMIILVAASCIVAPKATADDRLDAVGAHNLMAQAMLSMGKVEQTAEKPYCLAAYYHHACLNEGIEIPADQEIKWIAGEASWTQAEANKEAGQMHEEMGFGHFANGRFIQAKNEFNLARDNYQLASGYYSKALTFFLSFIGWAEPVVGSL